MSLSAFSLILAKIALNGPSDDDDMQWDRIKSVLEEHPLLSATDVQRLVEMAAVPS